MDSILDKNKVTGKRILLPCFLVIGLFLRLNCLTARPVWYDEAITIFYAKSGIDFILTNFWHGSNPPFAYLFYHFWAQLFGESQLSFELVSVIFGVLSVGAIYHLAKKMFSESTGLIAACLLTFSSYHVFVSQQIRGYSMACFFSLMSIVFFMNLKDRGKIPDFLGWVFFSCLMILTHFFTIFVFGIELVMLWILTPEAKKQNLSLNVKVSIVSGWMACVALAAVAALKIFEPNLFPIYPRPQASAQDMQLIFQSIAFLSKPLAVLSLSAVIGLLVVIFRLKNRSEFRSVVFLFGWLTVSILIPFFMSKDGSSFFYVRYYIFSHLAWVLLTSRGIDLLARGFWKVIIPIVFVVLLSLLLNDYYAECREKNQLKQDFEMVQKEFAPGDVVLHENGWTFGPSYYYHGARLPEFFVTDEFGLPGLWNKKVDWSSFSSFRRVWFFVESSDRFLAIAKSDWFRALHPRVVRQGSGGEWYLLEIGRI